MDNDIYGNICINNFIKMFKNSMNNNDNDNNNSNKYKLNIIEKIEKKTT